MFNLGLTGMFSGATPDTVLIPAHLHSSAVAFYKARLGARALNSGQLPVVLQSKHGFRLKVGRISRNYATGGSVCLHLPSNANPATVARGLSGGAKVQRTRAGFVTVDPYGVTWTVA